MATVLRSRQCPHAVLTWGRHVTVTGVVVVKGRVVQRGRRSNSATGCQHRGQRRRASRGAARGHERGRVHADTAACAVTRRRANGQGGLGDGKVQVGTRRDERVGVPEEHEEGLQGIASHQLFGRGILLFAEKHTHARTHRHTCRRASRMTFFHAPAGAVTTSAGLWRPITRTPKGAMAVPYPVHGQGVEPHF